MIKWYIRKKFPVKSPVYVRHYTDIGFGGGYDRYEGTVAGYGGYRILVRYEDKVRLFDMSEVTIIQDEVEVNAEV